MMAHQFLPAMDWTPTEEKSQSYTSLPRPVYVSCHQDHSHPAAFQFLPLQASTPALTRQPRPRFLTLTSPPRLPSPTPFESIPRKASPFMRLPTEIRLHIYRLLVLPTDPQHLQPSYQKINASAPDCSNHQKKYRIDDASADYPEQTLMIRTIDPLRYASKFQDEPHARKAYSVRADRFRARCMKTTYHCINNPRIEDNLAIMRTCQRIHAEVAELLYSSYTFDFDSHVEAIIPFLSDLTPFARSCVRSIRLVKRALPYDKESDKCEWSNAMRYLTTRGNNIKIRALQLGVVAGRPGRSGWDRIATYSAADFAMLAHRDGMEWMQYLLEIEGLDFLDVQPVVEHCPPASSSSAMAHYVRFSASIEAGFTDFLRARLLARPPPPMEQLACRL